LTVSIRGGLLRRYRCSGRRAVLRARPDGHFRRFQASIVPMRSSIAVRLETGRRQREPPGSRSRRGHWLRALIKNVCGRFGMEWRNRLMEGFDELMEMGRIPVTRGV
jgi:hypothetical protein